MIAPSDLLNLKGHKSLSDGLLEPMQWLEAAAERSGDAIAVISTDGRSLSYNELLVQIKQTSDFLLDLNVGRGDVVLVMLPNGPEALTVLLSVLSTAIAIPLGTDEPLESIERLINELPVKAVVFDQRYPSLPMKVCQNEFLIPISLKASSSSEYLYDISGPESQGERGSRSQLTDAAVIGRTSGTSSVPKLVAWSQASLFKSAETVAEWMELEDTDRSLCLMPFITLHTLVRSCLPILLRGGCVVCPPGFNKNKVLSWIADYQPTFMTAVPSIYKEILEKLNGDSLETNFRFLVAGSDNLDSETAVALNRAFGIPIREFYGMNEISPMLAASRHGRMPGDNRLVVMEDWEVQVRGDNGEVLLAGELGELAVTGGFFNHVLNSHIRMSDGYYLTGDLGKVGGDGTIEIAGRIDDRINRGGKKVSPQAVEEILKQHPDVVDAVVFPVCEHVLGQRVAAAVIVTMDIDELLLRGYVADRLPDFMVPDLIVITDCLPLTELGKVSRKSMADLLGVVWRNNGVKPVIASDIGVSVKEQALVDLIREVTGIAVLEVADDFMEMGGDSFSATVLLVEIEDRFGVLLTPGQFLKNSSARGLAALIESSSGTVSSLLEKVKEGDDTSPLFFAHGPGGYSYYAGFFVNHLDQNQTVYGLHVSDQGNEMEQYASQFVEAIKTISPQGPYLLAGHSFGAQLAFEIAQQLTNSGGYVTFLALIDDEADLFKRKFGTALLEDVNDSTMARFKGMLDRYVVLPYPGDIDLFIADDAPLEKLADPLLGWGDICQGEVTAFNVPGSHITVMSEEKVELWGELFNKRLKRSLASRYIHPEKLLKRITTTAQFSAKEEIKAVINARSAARKGDLQEEVLNYRKAIGLHSDQPYWVYRNYAHACRQAGEQKEVVPALREAMNKENVPVLGAIELAKALRKDSTKRREAFQLLFHAEALLTDEIKAWNKLSECWLSMGESITALNCVNKALEIEPESSSLQCQLCKILIKQKRYPEALVSIERILTSGHNNFEGYVQKGRLEIALNQPHQALLSLEKALSYSDGLKRPGQVYGLISKVYQSLKQSDKALEYARSAWQMNSNNTGNTLLFASQLMEQKKWSKTEALLTNLVERHPRLINAHRKLSETCMSLGNYKKACKHIEQVVELNPRNSVHYQLLGRVNRYSGNRKAAAVACLMALRINPISRSAWSELLKNIVNVRRK